MAPSPVPVTLGSPDFHAAGITGFTVTQIRFPAGTVLEPHSHDRHIFAVMLNGSFDLRFSGATHECRPAAVFTEPAGERHSNRVSRAGASLLVVQPDPGQAELWRPFARLWTGFSLAHHGGIAYSAARAAREIRTPDALSPLAVEALVLEMLIAAARVGPGCARGGGPPDWLLRVQEMLHAERAGRFCTADLAREVSVHPAYLAREFRDYFHVSIGLYARRLRLERATERLLRSEETVAAIALDAGFADQSHFTRTFKRYAGLTPAQFRRQRARPLRAKGERFGAA